MLWICLILAGVLVFNRISAKQRRHINDMMIVGKELNRLSDAGRIEKAQYAGLRALIDKNLRINAKAGGRDAVEDAWESALNDSWDRLIHELQPYPRPNAPWRAGRDKTAVHDPPPPPRTAPPPLPEAIEIKPQTAWPDLETEFKPPPDVEPVFQPVESAPDWIQSESETIAETVTIPDAREPEPDLDLDTPLTEPPGETEPVQLEETPPEIPLEPPAAPPSPESPPPIPKKPDRPKKRPVLKDIRRKKPDEATEFAWRPAKASAMERAIQAVSGWPKLLIPFIRQNIGWFIGGFLFVSGSVFLVAQSTGFAKYLIISLFLFASAMMLLGGSVRMLKKRPDLYSVGAVLIFLGMLLIPLCVASSVRLIDMGSPHPGKMAMGIAATLLMLGFFYWISQLASGIVHRKLQAPHTKLFIALCALQSGVPLVNTGGHWAVPAFFHCLLAGIFAYSVIRHSEPVLTSIFIDKEKIAVYVSGTLIFALFTAFSHLTWAYQGRFPDGYAGPFLMGLAGVLFYIDSRLKQWTHQYSYLSRFSFLVYGLSFSALAAAYPGQPALLITLAAGLAVYGTVVWRYLTVIPLYCCIGCASWMYWLIALQHLPFSAWCLASIPGLSLFPLLNRWAVLKNAENLSVVLFRSMILLTAVPGIFSLIHSAPGWTAFFTGLFMTLSAYVALEFIPSGFTGIASPWKTPEKPAGDAKSPNYYPYYVIPLCFAVTIGFAPVSPFGSWAAQYMTVMALSALAAVITSVYAYRRGKAVAPQTIEIFMNSAPAYLLAALYIGFIRGAPPLNNPAAAPVLAISGAVLLIQGIFYRMRPLLFGALILFAAAGGLFKKRYIPGPSSGLAEVLMVFPVLWALIQMELRKKAIDIFAGRFEESPKPRFLGITAGGRALFDVLAPPLKTALLGLLGWGLFRWGSHGVYHSPSASWILNAFAGAAAAACVMAYFRKLALFPVSILMGLAGALGLISRLFGAETAAFCIGSALYALFIWAAVLKLSEKPLTKRVLLLLSVGKTAAFPDTPLIRTAHPAAAVIMLATTAAAVIYWIIYISLDIVPVFVCAILFFGFAGYVHRIRYYTYLMSASALAILASLYALWTPFPDFHPAAGDPYFPLTGVLAAAALYLTAIAIERLRYPKFPDTGFSESLYRKPFRIMAGAVVFLCFARTLYLMTAEYPDQYGIISSLCVIISGCVMLTANTRLKYAFLSFAGFAALCIAVLRLETALIHPDTHFSFVFYRFAPGQLLTIAVLSAAAGFVADQWFKKPVFPAYYAYPLWITGILCFVPALLKTVFSGWRPELLGAGFPQTALLFGILAVSIIPLMTPVPKADRFREGSLLYILTGIAASAAALYGVSVISPVFLIMWAFCLWIMANYLFSPFSVRFPNWRIASDIFPAAGFILIVIALAARQAPGLNWSLYPSDLFAVFDRPALAALCVYAVLMLKNSRWAGLPWIAGAAASMSLFMSGYPLLKLLGTKSPYDQWLMLSMTALIVSMAGYAFMRFASEPRRLAPAAGLFTTPLYAFSWILFVWTILGTGLDMVQPRPFRINSYFPVIMGNCLLAQFPLLQPYTNAYPLRGVLSMLFLTLMAIGTILRIDINIAQSWGLLAWGYMLWILANFAIPAFNRRLPLWAIDPRSWPWAGLACILLSFPAFSLGRWTPVVSHAPADLIETSLWGYIAALKLYCILMRKNSSWFGFPWLIAAGAAITVFSVVLEGMILLGWNTASAQWAVLAAVSMILAAVSRMALHGRSDSTGAAMPQRLAVYLFSGPEPLYWVSAALFSWTLAGMTYSIISGVAPLTAHVSITFILSALTVFVLVEPRGVVSIRIRTIAVFILLSGAYLNSIAISGVQLTPPYACFVWAAVAWAAGSFVIPMANRKSPYFSLDPGLMILSGLVFYGVLAPVLERGLETMVSWRYTGLLSAYLFMMLTYYRQSGWIWAAFGFLSLSVLTLTFTVTRGRADLLLFFLGALVWANVLPAGARLFRRLRFGRPDCQGIRRIDPSLPMLAYAAFILAGLLAIETIALFFRLTGILNPSSLVWIAAAAVLTSVHIHLVRKTPFPAHLSLYALFLGFLTIPLPLGAPLRISIWAFVLFVIGWRQSRGAGKTGELLPDAVLTPWIMVPPWAGLMALMFMKIGSFPELLAALAALTLTFAGVARNKTNGSYLWTARILFLIFLHTWPAVFLPSGEVSQSTLLEIWPMLAAQFQRLKILFPWYALQLSALSWFISPVYQWMAAPFSKKPVFCETFTAVWIETGLAAAGLGVHAALSLNALYTGGPVFNIHACAALAAALFITARMIRETMRRENPYLVYITVCMAAAAGIYARLMFLGLEPAGPLDTVLIIGSGYMVFTFYRFTGSNILARPLYLLALTVPLAALLTIPLKFNDPHAAASFLVLGTLYLSIRHTVKSLTALLLGAVFLNAAIYLWIPGWAEQTHMIQLYTVPAAVSVLILLHLHSHEIKKSVLNGARLAAISILYACATLDVFLKPDLLFFVSALGLSLLGTALGFILRIRAFLYGGVVFMIINVAGQLIRFYFDRRDTLWEGAILVGLGFIIISGMIWFNIRKEEILNRIRIFRSDLESWD